ncbi:MAG: hypothetical protein D6806_12980 [Deltaproteobacteria bacterium]|nr:MAG: hypothetical protein D6806_12980 [Deltaproteobacteria bacterium]
MLAMKQAMELKPPESEAVTLLEECLSRPSQRLTAAELLLPVYRQMEDFKKLVAVLEMQLGVEETPQKRVELYQELMKIYEEQIGQKPLAFTVACRAFREFPSDSGIRADLERLAEQTGSMEELAAVYEEVVEKVRDTDAGPDIERRLAQLKEAYLEDKDEALAHWRHVLASDPDDPEALKALERLYRERGMYAELVGILRHLATMEADRGRKKDVLHEIAAIMEERLGRDDGAIEAYKEILELDPNDLAVLRLVDRLMHRQGMWEELSEVLQRQMQLAGESEIPDLRLRLAQIYQLHLGQPQLAVEQYKLVLDALPDDSRAVQELLRMFQSVEHRHLVVDLLVEPLERTGDWKNLIEVLDAKARMAQDTEQRKQALLKMSHIYSDRFGNKDMAMTIMGRAFVIQPSDQAVMLELEKLAEELQRHEILSAIYEQALEQAEQDQVKLVLHRRLAGLYAQRLKDRESAREHLEAMLEINPGEKEAASLLEQFYRHKGDYVRLARILDKRLAAEQDEQARVGLLKEKALICIQHLEEPGSAADAYRQILELRPDDAEALEGLDRLYTERGRSRDLLAILETKARILEQQGQQEQALETLLRLAKLLEQDFHDFEKCGQVLGRILEKTPNHAGAIEYLEQLVTENQGQEEMYALLENAYERSGQWQKYIDLLESQVRRSRVMARRIQLLEKIAEIQEHRLGLKTLAFNTTVRIFHEDVTNSQTRENLERLAREDDNLEALAAVYEEELDNIEDPEVGAEIALKVAKIQLEQLGDEDEALGFFKTALRFDAKSREALDALDGIYSRRGDTENLLDVLQRKLNIVEEDAQKVDVLFRSGRIYYEHLQQPEKSVGYFRKVLDLDPDHEQSLRFLEMIYAELGETEQLFDVLQKRFELVTDTNERIELVARMADIASEQLGDVDRAIELWKDASEEPRYAEDAFEALDKLYEKAGRWPELAALIEQRMSATSDPEKLAELSSRLGWVKGEKLGELEDAKKHFQEVLKLDPKDVAALEALRGIYTAAGEWENLVGVLRRLVQLQDDMEGVKRIRFELAEVLGSKLQRREEAIDAAKRAADIEPHSPEDLERLARIFMENEAWQDAAQVLELAADRKEIEAEKIQALLEVAEIWRDQIGRPLGAAPLYEKVLEFDPYHEKAFKDVEQIYREQKEWRRLCTLLENRLSLIKESRDRLVLMKEIAEIYEQRLGQKELAFAKYCAAFREDFTNDEILAKLETLASETEDYDTLLEVLEDATEEVKLGHRAVDLYLKIADVYRRHLGDLEKAEEKLRTAAEADPRDTKALSVLKEILEEQGQYDRVVEVLEQSYERCDELDERKEIRRRIAEIHEHQLQRPDLAIESYKRILELDGRDTQSIEALIRLLQSHQRWEELIKVLRRAAEQAEENEQAVKHLMHIGSIYEVELDDDENAIATYRQTLEVDPKNLEANKALERIYTRLDRWSELLEIFERQIELVEQVQEKVRLYQKMGGIWEERFSNLEKAAACHVAVLELESTNLPSIKALERLYKRLGEFEKLIELYYRHLELTEDASEKVEIYLDIGEVWYRELSRVDKAEEVFNLALEVDAKSIPAIHALGQLYEKSGNWFNAIEMLQREAELMGASPETVDLYYRMGKINEDMLQDSQAAKDAYTKALAIDPTYLPAIKALKLIYYLDKDYDAYLEMIIQEAEHTEDVEERTRLLYEIGRFLQDQYEDSKRAATYYEQALQLTPDFLPAAKPLADIYFRTEQWEDAEKMMEIVVAGMDRNTEAKELCRQYYRLGYITEKLGKSDKALEHYRQSYELDATYLPALEGLGNALIKAEQWEEAYRIYQTILIHHRDSLSDAEVAELYWQIGDINFQMGERERAISSFRKALEIDDTHLASMQYLVSIYGDMDEWEEAYDYSLRMVDALEEDELPEHYLKLGQMCREKLEDPFRAIDAYQGVLRHQPDNLEALTRLLEVFRETGQFQKAVDTLERIVEVESRPSKLVEYHKQAAEFLAAELGNDTEAVEHLNKALDIDPSQVACFSRIVQILRARKDWQGLKQNYIRMIKRLPVEARRTKLALWKDLGELCRVVLRNLNESIDAYRMVTTLDPSDSESLAILGDLLAARPDTRLEAIETHHKVLKMAADRVASYRALWKLYNQQKDYDKVFALASILRYLKKADEEERKIYNYFSRKAPQLASRAISDRMWDSMLAHPGVKVPFTKIFTLLFTKAPGMFFKDHRDLELKRQHAIDLARDRSLVSFAFKTAAKVLGTSRVELFAKKDTPAPQPPGIIVAPTQPMSLIAFQEMFRQDNKKHLLFHMARHLAASRPQFFLAYSLSVRELEVLLQAACWLVEPDFNPTFDRRQVEQVRSKLRRHLSEAGQGMLRRAVEEYLANRRAYDLRRWVEAVEHSINRAGFVVCNDVAAALTILKREQAWLTPMRSIQKVREVLVFAASPEYLNLRQALGLAVSA